MKVGLKTWTLGSLLNMITEVSDKVRLSFSKDGLNVKVVDGANVCSLVCDIQPDEFELFDVDEPTDLIIDVGALLRIVKKLNQCYTVYLTQEDGFTFLDAENRWFDITYPDEIRAPPRILNLELPISFVAHTEDFSTDLKLCEMVSNHIDMCYLPGYVEIKTIVDSKLKSKFSYPTSEVMESPKNSVYSLDYLSDIVTSLEYKKEWVCKKVEVKFNEDWPLTLSGNISDNFKFCFMLAPRLGVH
jgi:DNA polymerase III sliding clamp (beta) subunit (PCNA family)